MCIRKILIIPKISISIYVMSIKLTNVIICLSINRWKDIQASHSTLKIIQTEGFLSDFQVRQHFYEFHFHSRFNQQTPEYPFPARRASESGHFR